jgi:hypothetical protein
MKSLGISVEETAIIYGVFPLFSIFAPYAMGIIADKLGNFKVYQTITKNPYKKLSYVTIRINFQLTLNSLKGVEQLSNS